MKKIEIIGKRGPREKHFLQEDGTFLAEMYDEDIHFLKNGKYEEIDNTLLLENGFYKNKYNNYIVKFAAEPQEIFMTISKDEYYMNVGLKKYDKYVVENQNLSNKFSQSLLFKNVLKNVDLRYDIKSNIIKENIIINDKMSEINNLTFVIDTNLILKINDDNSISGINNKNDIIFKFDAPFIIDKNGISNYNVKYELIKENSKYYLYFIMDNEWLNNAIYPVTIDPTIINYSSDNNVIDTYIYPGDTNDVRYNLDNLSVGVERKNNTYVTNRSLLRFDLPSIGTGSQVVKAFVTLTDFPDLSDSLFYNTVDVHRITSDWTESGANWQTMNDKFDPRVEASLVCYRWYDTEDGHFTYFSSTDVDITSLVQKWYTGTPNNGIMLIASNETYQSDVIAMFFSKENLFTGLNPKPVLAVVYRNQTGLENYMNYEQQVLSHGILYHNTYNGNLTHVLDLSSTKCGKMPVTLQLVYNTNDVVLNRDIGYGVGYRFNLSQTIKEVSIDNKTYLEYIDEDGTIHYFLNEKSELENGEYHTVYYDNTFFDEDGLNFEIERTSTKYILKDKNNNRKEFSILSGVGYLTKLQDVSGNINTITYDNNNRITSITDANNQIILITYSTNPSKIINIDNPDNTSVRIEYRSNSIYEVDYYSNQSVEALTYYCENNLIKNITDINGKKIEYDYYEQSPYKIKKVSEYGLNNSVGNFYEAIYGFNVTSLINRDNQIKNIIYNSFGNPISVSEFEEENDLKNTYGYQMTYDNSPLNPNITTNNISSEQIPIKTIKNLLKNTSFEGTGIYFDSNDYAQVYISNEFANTGKKSLRYKSNSGVTDNYIQQTVSVEGGKNYTFSAYVKTSIWNAPVKLSIRYYDNNDSVHEEISEAIVSDSFTRLDVSIYVPDNLITSEVVVSVVLEGTGLCYIDDIQLEEGRVANYYNLIDNSDFSDGLSDWDLYSYNSAFPVASVFDVIDINNNSMLKVNMNTSNETAFQKDFDVNGRQYDTFNLSFWFKNEGICGGTDEIGSPISNSVSIIFYPEDEQTGGDSWIEIFNLNPCQGEWQFFSHNFKAEYDFKSFRLIFSQSLNGNSFYITNINLFKSLPNIEYRYDDKGNLITTKKLSSNMLTNKFDVNNQLISSIDSKNSKLYYEYDNLVTDRVIRGVASSGISNELTYDSFGNINLYRIINKGQVINDKDGSFSIRLKGTNNTLKLLDNSIMFETDVHGHNKWNFENVVIDNVKYYRISHSIINNKYLTNENNSVIVSSYNQDASLFELIKQEDNSFALKNKSNSKYLKFSNNTLIFDEFEEGNSNYKFYLEEKTFSKFLENEVIYDLDGKYISQNINSDFSKNYYNIGSNTGLVETYTNSIKNTTNYVYDDFGRLIQVNDHEKQVNFQYTNKILSRISQNNRIYNFIYDNFLNLVSVTVGNNLPLYTNTYDSYNGNLLSINYGNNQTISYEYNTLNRIKKKIKTNDTFEYLYDNNNNISKVVSNNYLEKYLYDFAKRLYEYSFNNFKIKYTYDNNENIVSKEYKLNGITHTLNNILNNDDTFIKTVIDNLEFNYEYDDIGRLTELNYNNSFNINYDYVTNGDRTTMLVRSINNNGDKYDYKYDKLGRITHVYHNSNLKVRYFYDEYNQLIRDDNYSQKITTRYKYDLYGNILYKNIYELNTYNQIESNKFKYNNSWCDQLTNYNGNTITYDNIGNPLTIGNSISLTWCNGRILEQYINGNNIIEFTYDENDIRTKKIVNNIETEYYKEGNNIILEKTGNNVLYYLRNNNNELVGFKYNNDVYYYVKNLQKDVIQILNSNYGIVANYSYDSWGNITSITDGNGLDVSNNNNHIANINPFRYRSYYYDKETNLYYLNKRYYNPCWGRFLNVDEYINGNKDIISNNMYLYCSNDPINNIDKSGESFLKLVTDIVRSITNLYHKVKSAIKKLTKPKKTTPHTMTTTPYSNLPDYSKELDRVLQKNASQASLVSSLTSYPLSLSYFKEKVDKKKEWDYKEYINWKRDIDLPFLEYNGKFIYHGRVTTAEDFGNIHYGYVGSAMGIPNTVLFMGGGYAKCGLDSKVFEPPYFCDDPNDHTTIQRGIDMFYGETY